MSGSPGGQVIGRVSVKVLPDTSEFSKQKLERQLNREVKDAQIAVQVAVELDKKSLDKVKEDLRHFVHKINPIKIQVKPEMALGATTLINQRLNYASRARTAPILPYLMPGSVNAVSRQMGTMLAAFSGGRMIKSFVSDFGEFIKTIDKSAPKIGLITNGLVGIVGLGLTAGSNLFAMSAALAQIGAVALTLPATFASAAIGVGILIAAFKDFNTVLPEVKAKLSELQNLISGNFWSKAKAPFQEMINTLFPAFSKGLGSVSTEMGTFFGSLATALGSALGPTVGSMFTQLASSITIAEGAAKPLAGIITNFGKEGAAWLPKMSQWIVDITTKFDDWLTRVTDSGQFTTWVQNGLTALSDLGRVLGNVAGILSAIATAASAAGGSSLGMMADTLERVNTAVSSPAFQGGLVKTLTAAHLAMSQIATASGPAVSKLFDTLASTLSTLLPIAGQAIGSLVSSLATALSNPAFVSGFENLIKGFGDAIVALGPALVPISSMLGALGSVLGQFLANVGPVAGEILGTLASAFGALLPALQPLISVLTGVLGQAFAALAPVIQMIGQSIGALVTGGILPALVSLFSSLMPVFTQLASVVGGVLGQAFTVLGPLFVMLGDALGQILPLFGQLIIAVMPLVGALLPALGAILGAIIPVIVMIAQAVLPPLIAAVTALVSALVPVINVIATVITWLVGQLAPVITFIAGLLIGIVTSLLNGFTNIFEGIMGIWEGFKTMFSGGWGNFFTGLWQVVVGIWNLIIGVIEVALNIGILGTLKKAWAGIKALWELGWNAIVQGAKIAWAMIKGAFTAFLGAIKAAPGAYLNAIKTLFTAAWNAVLFGVRFAFGLVESAVKGKLDSVVSLVRGIPGKAKEALGNIGSTLSEAGRKLLEGFITGIRSKIDGVKDTLQGLTKKLTDWKGPESLDRVLLVSAGQLIIDGLIVGLESRYDGVRRSLRGLTNDIGGMEIASPKVADLSGSYAAVNAALGGGNAATGGNTTYEINVPMMPTNSSPEDVANEILFAQKRIAYGSAYAN